MEDKTTTPTPTTTTTTTAPKRMGRPGRPIISSDGHTFAGVGEAARFYGADHSGIWQVCAGKAPSWRGLTFRWADKPAPTATPRTAAGLLALLSEAAGRRVTVADLVDLVRVRGDVRGVLAIALVDLA